MPTYVCSALAGVFDATKRSQATAMIARAHSEATGAPEFFVQTHFVDADAGHRYLGTVAVDDHIWIRGDIRAGRSSEARTLLMRAIMEGVAGIAGVATDKVWVYLDELAPTNMIEYGHVLPAPGEEQAWFDALPAHLRVYLERLGTDRANLKL